MIIRLLLTNFVIPIIGMIYLYILMAKDYNLYYTNTHTLAFDLSLYSDRGKVDSIVRRIG